MQRVLGRRRRGVARQQRRQLRKGKDCLPSDLRSGWESMGDVGFKSRRHLCFAPHSHLRARFTLPKQSQIQPVGVAYKGMRRARAAAQHQLASSWSSSTMCRIIGSSTC